MFNLDFFAFYSFIIFTNIILVSIFLPCLFGSMVTTTKVGSTIVKYGCVSSILFPILSTFLGIYFENPLFILLNIFPVMSMTVGTIIMNFED